MITHELIEEAKNRLIKAYKPRSIYIFGSYVWGEPDDESDLDLLIVVDTYEKANLHSLLVKANGLRIRETKRGRLQKSACKSLYKKYESASVL